jgi:hypothetical protein
MEKKKNITTFCAVVIFTQKPHTLVKRETPDQAHGHFVGVGSIPSSTVSQRRGPLPVPQGEERVRDT